MFKVTYHNIDNGEKRAKVFKSEKEAEHFAGIMGYEYGTKIEIMDADYSEESMKYDLTNAVEDIQNVVRNGIPEVYGNAEAWAFEFCPSHLPWQPEIFGDVTARLIDENETLLDKFEKVTGFDLKSDLRNLIELD